MAVSQIFERERLASVVLALILYLAASSRYAFADVYFAVGRMLARAFLRATCYVTADTKSPLNQCNEQELSGQH